MPRWTTRDPDAAFSRRRQMPWRNAQVSIFAFHSFSGVVRLVISRLEGFALSTIPPTSRVGIGTGLFIIAGVFPIGSRPVGRARQTSQFPLADSDRGILKRQN